jgi:hypothetical protein
MDCNYWNKIPASDRSEWISITHNIFQHDSQQSAEASKKTSKKLFSIPVVWNSQAAANVD